MKVFKNVSGVINLNKSVNTVVSFFKVLVATVLIFGVMCGSFLGVAAATGIEEKGFVEYSTEASINFNEIIEVVLTDVETNYRYTHYLYRTNDYAANMSIPLGTYSISARVVSDTGDDLSGYDVIYSKDNIAVENTKLAVSIPLRVEVIMSVSASPDDYNDGGLESMLEDLEDEESVSTETSSPDDEEVVSEQETVKSPVEDSKGVSRSSVFVSLFLSVILIVIGVIVYLFIKKRG